MEKFVVIIGKEVDAGGDLAAAIAATPGLSVTHRSRRLIDVEAEAPQAAEALRTLVADRGVGLERAPEAQLMEPIDPLKHTP